MDLIQESQLGDTYQVAYQVSNNLIQVVRVNVSIKEKSTSVLEIQRMGIELLIEGIEFRNGKPINLNQKYSPGTILPFPEDYDHKNPLDLLMERYAREFKPIFDSNPKLQEYLPTQFSALVPYLNRIK